MPKIRRICRGVIPAATVTTAGILAIAACGSSSSKSSTTTGGPTASAAGSSSSTGSSGASASASSGSGATNSALEVSGDFSASAKQAPDCGELQDQGGGKFRIPLTFTPTASTGGIASGTDYSLTFLQTPSGKTQLTGSALSAQMTVKFSFQLANNDSLNWGVNAAPPNPDGQAAPGSASGNLDISSDGKKGTADLTLGFAGDDQQKVKLGDHKDIHIVASWTCP